MIILDFKVDKSAIIGERQHINQSLDIELFAYTFFYLPVRFTIDSTDLFGSDRHPLTDVENDSQTLSSDHILWHRIPFLHVAVIGTSVVLGLQEYRKTVYYSHDQRLFFEIHDNQVLVHTNLLKRSVYCEYAELVSAFFEFREKAKTVLSDLVPELQLLRDWPTWLYSQDNSYKQPTKW